MIAHSTPIKVPHLQQIHTQALAENGTHPQQSAHILQPHHSHILNPSDSARVSWHHLYMTSWSSPSFEQANSMAVTQNKIGISGFEPELQRWEFYNIATILPATIKFQIWQLIYCRYHSPGLLPHLSSRWAEQTRLINSQGTNHESWMVRCSPRAPEFSCAQSA